MKNDSCLRFLDKRYRPISFIFSTLVKETR